MSDSLIYRILIGISGLVVGMVLQFLVSQSVPPNDKQIDWVINELIDNPHYFGMWKGSYEGSSMTFIVDSVHREGVFNYRAFINDDRDTVLLIHFQY